MSLYVRYSKEPPYLPEAVADSPKELSEMTGISRGVIMSSLSHGHKTFAKVADWKPKKKNFR